MHDDIRRHSAKPNLRHTAGSARSFTPPGTPHPGAIRLAARESVSVVELSQRRAQVDQPTRRIGAADNLPARGELAAMYPDLR
jgi:hypothetical protein